jgi:hypothetical protein
VPRMTLPMDAGLTRARKLAAIVVAGQFPLLAQMRSAERVRKCLLFGVDRTYRGHHETDALDPKRSFTVVGQ